MDSTSRTTGDSARDRLYRCDGVVLRRLDFGETDRILTVLTDRYGKFRVIAKGVRKPATRLAAHLELFAESRLVLSRGRDLDIVTGAETLELNGGLRDDLVALGVASHCVELVDRFLADRDENVVVYRALVQALHDLSTGQDAARVARAFEFLLLGEMGVRPELFTCVACGSAIEATPNRFSVRGGGVLCTRHTESDLGAPILSLAGQKVMRLLVRGGRAEFLQISIPDAVNEELELVLGSFIKHQLERDLLSLRVSRRVEESLPVWDNQTSTK